MKEYQILIIEDEEGIRQSLKGYLVDDGFLVTDTSSAEEGLIIIEEYQFDLSIVDMRLTGADGNYFILNANKKWPNMKFIIYTGSTDYIIPKALQELGINNEDVFYKPLFDLGLLTQAIRRLLNIE
jgi:DNA-binding NtrC family response regulator